MTLVLSIKVNEGSACVLTYNVFRRGMCVICSEVYAVQSAMLAAMTAAGVQARSPNQQS
jgi:hypothetical protein